MIMGKKKHHKIKTHEKYKTRAELLLDTYDPDLLDLWFGDDEAKRLEFSKWLVRQEELDSDSPLDDLKTKDHYKEKINKELSKEHDSMNDILMGLFKIKQIQQDKKKDKKKMKKIRNRDLSLATYMNSDKYKKSYLNNDEYRKALKKIAKQEKDEEDTMRKLGYIRSKSADAELEKLMKKSREVEAALSDAYIQKFYIK